YVQSHVRGPLPAVSGVAEEETLFDGYSCAWWNDRADFQKAMSTPAWQRILEDGPKVFDVDWLWNMSAHIEEHPMIEGPANPAPRPARRSNTDQRRIRLREFDSVTSAGDDVPGSNSPRSAY